MTREPWEEPSAGKPHARVCGGEAEWPSYPTIPCRADTLASLCGDAPVLAWVLPHCRETNPSNNA